MLLSIHGNRIIGSYGLYLADGRISSGAASGTLNQAEYQLSLSDTAPVTVDAAQTITGKVPATTPIVDPNGAIGIPAIGGNARWP